MISDSFNMKNTAVVIRLFRGLMNVFISSWIMSKNLAEHQYLYLGSAGVWVIPSLKL